MPETDRVFGNCLFADGGYPMRLMPGTRSAYHRMGPAFRARADCTAGVCLRFATDEETLGFRAETVSFCRSRNVVDVYENGIMTGSVRLADMQPEAEFAYRRKTSGRARIELWLPNTCGLRVRELAFGSWEPVETPGRKLLLLGDSILQGIDCYHPTDALANQLMLTWDAEGVNQSVGGAQFFPETLEELPFRPDRILVALGGNDAFHPSPDREERIIAYFERLRALYPTTPTAAVTPVWTMRLAGDARLADEFSLVRDLIRREAARQGIRVIDGMALLPRAQGFFNEDGIHPNGAGFLRYALALGRMLSWDRWNGVD